MLYYVGLDVREYSDTSQWTNQAHFPLKLSGNFPRGTVMLFSTHSSTKMVFCLCSKSLFSQLAASTGETEHILQTSMRNTLTKQTTNSEHGYRNADNVSLFFFISFPLPPSSNTVSVIVYHLVLGIFCCSVWMFRSFPWVLRGKKILAAFHIDSPRLQDLEPFSLPNNGPPLPFIISLCLPLFLLLPFLLLFFIKTSAKRELCGLLLCARGKGALD